MNSSIVPRRSGHKSGYRSVNHAIHQVLLRMGLTLPNGIASQATGHMGMFAIGATAGNDGIQRAMI
jgi:hypothetical protein